MPRTRRTTFYDVLTAAISDITHRGFDSAGRLEEWMVRLRDAAELSLGSTATQEKRLKDSLALLYRRLVERGQIAQHHPGVDRFTIEKLKPQLRAELDKRVMASADLIKLNRKAAIEKTLQRFSGWASSVPRGGSAVANKPKTRTEIRKALGQLPFEERRVLIDQGHKFTAAISDVIAREGGAIALIWRSHWRQAGYDYREEHKERDGQVYVVRPNWALDNGLMRSGPAGFYDQITAVGEEVFCRCQAQYLYSLRQLPRDMVTDKGRKALADARARIARGDDDEINGETVDRDHDVKWMSVRSRDGRKTYVDRTLPDEVRIAGKWLDPAGPLVAHEGEEWRMMQALLADFVRRYGREPDQAEFKKIYEYSHYHAGIPAERRRIRELGVSWPHWEAWCRGELRRLEHREIANPPPDPHVRDAA